MKIKQILNNNTILIKKGSNELIGLSKGIAFKKKVGAIIKEEELEKIFVLETASMLEHFSFQLSKCDPEYILIVKAMVEYAKEIYGLKVSDYIYLTLLDHIDFTIQRVKTGKLFSSPLQWEVKRFYQKEYLIGIWSVRFLREKTGLLIPEEEAIPIALHFINSQSDKNNMPETVQIVKIIDDIMTIVRYEFKREFQTDCFFYSRFITHLHYFAQRILNGSLHAESMGENEIYMQIKGLYPAAFQCVQKIKIYVYGNYELSISENEEIYLTIHIQKLTERVS